MHRHIVFLLAAVVALLGPAAAASQEGALSPEEVTQLLSQMPACGSPCFVAASAMSNCTFANIESCLCGDVPLQSKISACVQTSCPYDDQVKIVEVGDTLCEAWPKESRSHEVTLAATICLCLTLPVVFLRFYARFETTRQLWADDYFTILSAVLLAALAGIHIASAHMGFGEHYWTVEVEQAEKLIKLFWVAQMIYVLVQTFAKVAILLLLARIFFHSRWSKIVARAFNIILFISGFVFVFVVIFQCVPVNSIWDRTIVDRKCLKPSMIGYVGAGVSITEDIIILLLPVPELMALSLDWRKKLSLALVFGVGSFACLTSMVRLKYLVHFNRTFDTTWDNVDVVIWSMIEMSSAVFCGSMVALGPLLRRWVVQVRDCRKGKSIKEGGGTGKDGGDGGDDPASWRPKTFSRVIITGGSNSEDRSKHLSDQSTAVDSKRSRSNTEDEDIRLMDMTTHENASGSRLSEPI